MEALRGGRHQPVAGQQRVTQIDDDSETRRSSLVSPPGPPRWCVLSRAMMIFLLGLAAMCPGPSPKFFSVIRPYRRTARTRVRVVSSSCATRRSRRFALRSSPPPVAAKCWRAKIFFRPHSRPGRGGRRSAVAAAADAKTPPVRRLRPRVKDHSAPFALTSRDHPLSSRRETLATPPSLSLFFSTLCTLVRSADRRKSSRALAPRPVARPRDARFPGPRDPDPKGCSRANAGSVPADAAAHGVGRASNLLGGIQRRLRLGGGALLAHHSGSSDASHRRWRSQVVRPAIPGPAGVAQHRLRGGTAPPLR